MLGSFKSAGSAVALQPLFLSSTGQFWAPDPFPGIDELQISRFNGNLATRLQSDLAMVAVAKLGSGLRQEECQNASYVMLCYKVMCIYIYICLNT